MHSWILYKLCVNAHTIDNAAPTSVDINAYIYICSKCGLSYSGYTGLNILPGAVQSIDCELQNL
jgi:hypothetical protein